MVGISKLYCGTIEPSDVLRYGRDSSKLPSNLLQFSLDKKPVVVWNCTKACNLKCVHCYSHSSSLKSDDELSNEQAKKMIDNLKSFGSPVILFSGGEPLMRDDIIDLVDYTVKNKIRAVLSTNGTLLTEQTVKKLSRINLSYIGISLDGLEETNDKFRGIKGAFREALEGIQNCLKNNIKVGIRFTINKQNFHDIPGIFRLIEEYNIPRICFYHLVYTGRAKELINEDLSHEQTREAVDQIIDLTGKLYSNNLQTEVLTVDNHCDAPYLYMRLLKEKNPRSGQVMKLLKYNQGNSSGVGIGCISWNGEVHADQFWRHYSFGNIKKRPFSEIWTDINNPLMKKLKNKKIYVKGRCSKCRWLDICGGNFRVRAEAVTGDLWVCDPACYLTDEEIGI